MKKTFLKIFLIGLLFTAFQTSAHAAKMGLNPSSDELKQGCEHTIGITIDTEGANTRGADAFLSYDPNEIELLDIRPGGVYKSYPGKIFGNGDIRITAFSQNGLFNGEGTLARLVFRSKPGVESAAIYFKYSPGATTDSNIAAEDASDILNGVYGGSYTFSPGPCVVEVPDTKPPWIENLKPGMDWKNMVPNTDLTFTILDNRSGVDLNSLNIEMDNVLYAKDGENTFDYQGSPRKYEITVNPKYDFVKREGELIPVTIRAKDLSQNLFVLNYTFTAYPIPECPECEIVYPAAPKVDRSLLLLLLIILALSLLLNLDMLVRPENHIVSQLPFGKRTKTAKANFIKHRIGKQKHTLDKAKKKK